MPIEAALFTVEIGGQQFAFDQSDIAFGDVDTREVRKTLATTVVKSLVRKRKARITLRNLTEAAIQTLEKELLAGAAQPLRDRQIGFEVLYDARLTSVEPKPIINVGGKSFSEEVTVQFTSQTYI